MDVIKNMDYSAILYLVYRMLGKMEEMGANWHQICFIRGKQG